uniref:Lipocalin-like domain-containing protein n=1 Tax=Loa loa TaxID=7209 RepID=A0A1I7VAK3_LOALO
MAKLIVHIAFFIYCQAAAPAARRGAGPAPNEALAAEITADYKAGKLWNDGRLITTTKVEECTFILYRIDL